MYVFDDATEFIQSFEATHKVKILRVPFSLSVSETAALLMCKMGRWYVSLPWLSQGVLEKNPKRFDLPALPKYWEIRDTRVRSKNVYSNKINIELDLTDQYNYTPNIRRKINKAHKNDIVILHGKRDELIKNFYTAYTHRMHEMGVPPQSLKHIIREVTNGSTEVFVAYVDCKPIGGATLSKITNEYYENGLFATLKAYNHLYPSYLLHKAMIEHSRECGAKTYSFGRSNSNGNVFKFKEHFHCQEVPLYWSYSHPKKRCINRYFTTLYSLLPYRFSIAIGGIIHKRIY